MVCFKKAKEWYEGLVNLYCSFLIKWYKRQERKYERKWIILVNKIPLRKDLFNRLIKIICEEIEDIHYRFKVEHRIWKGKRNTLKKWKETNK